MLLATALSKRAVVETGEGRKHWDTYIRGNVAQNAGSKASLAEVGLMAPSHDMGFQKSSRASALSACSSNAFISTRRVVLDCCLVLLGDVKLALLIEARVGVSARLESLVEAVELRENQLAVAVVLGCVLRLRVCACVGHSSAASGWRGRWGLIGAVVVVL